MMKNFRERKGEGGFTLIELLIVIIILAILAAIVIFAVGTTTKNAAVSACNSTVKSVQTAIQAFKAQTGTYPTALATLKTKTVHTGQTVGPWLRTLPPAALTPGNHKYAIKAAATTGLKNTGKILVLYKGGTKTGDTATACKTVH